VPKRPKRELEPLDVDAVTVVTIGTALWGVAVLVGLSVLPMLRRNGHVWWVQTAAVGFVVGLYGIWYCRRRRSAIRRTPQSGRHQLGG
jgi:hypothetical protein